MTSNNELPTTTVPSKTVELTITDRNALLITRDSSPVTDFTLNKTQTVQFHKLLEIGGTAELPVYHSRREYSLAQGYDPDPSQDHIVVKPGHSCPVELGCGTFTVQFTEKDVNAIWEFLTEHELTLQHHYGILTFPAMLTYDEGGASEPIIHQDYDEVLEHIYSSVGYWSDDKQQYVVRSD